MAIHCAKIIVLGRRKKLLYGGRCEVCQKSTPVSAMFSCPCGKKILCPRHRLPEDHKCSAKFVFDSTKFIKINPPKLVRIDD